jgi:hypothetical protein
MHGKQTIKFISYYLPRNDIYVKYTCSCVETMQGYVKVKRHQQSDWKAKNAENVKQCVTMKME